MGKKTINHGHLGANFKCPMCNVVGEVERVSGVGFDGEYFEEEYKCRHCGVKIALTVGDEDDLEDDHRDLLGLSEE